MPPKVNTASPTPGPSGVRTKNLVGDALYEWCRTEFEYGHILQQDDFSASGVVPVGDTGILLDALGYLTSKRLLKIHEIRGQEGLGWEVVAPQAAASYAGLSRDEQMVYAAIETVGTAGIWTKTIKAKSGVHAKVLDRVYKNLEHRQLIKQMKSVKNPGRKMYILFHLQPSEEATGGAWFTEGRLDVEMIDAISGFVENFCSERSWREVIDGTEEVEEDDDESLLSSRKRKQPVDGFDSKGKGKAVVRKRKIAYEPYAAGHLGYPTVRDVSKKILEANVLESGQILPDNALSQLMDVMTWDDRLYKLYRDPRQGEISDDPDTGKITMYRSFKTQSDLREEAYWRQKREAGSRTGVRHQELEDIGKGGTSEVPCFGCENFDICGDGGHVNAETCVYFAQWYEKMEEADRDKDDPWPSGKPLTKQPRR